MSILLQACQEQFLLDVLNEVINYLGAAEIERQHVMCAVRAWIMNAKGPNFSDIFKVQTWML